MQLKCERHIFPNYLKIDECQDGVVEWSTKTRMIHTTTTFVYARNIVHRLNSLEIPFGYSLCGMSLRYWGLTSRNEEKPVELLFPPFHLHDGITSTTYIHFRNHQKICYTGELTNGKQEQPIRMSSPHGLCHIHIYGVTKTAFCILQQYKESICVYHRCFLRLAS